MTSELQSGRRSIKLDTHVAQTKCQLHGTPAKFESFAKQVGHAVGKISSCNLNVSEHIPSSMKVLVYPFVASCLSGVLVALKQHQYLNN